MSYWELTTFCLKVRLGVFKDSCTLCALYTVHTVCTVRCAHKVHANQKSQLALRVREENRLPKKEFFTMLLLNEQD